MLPLGWLLAIKFGFGLTGLWVAMSAAWAFATVIYLYIVVTTDWQLQANYAKERNQSSLFIANE